MQPQQFQQYRHTIRFRGSTDPQGRYQLQISEVCANGQLQYRAQWNFSTLRQVLAFLEKYFPNSQALPYPQTRSLSFETVLSIVGLTPLGVAYSSL